jgi:hypothetical protein
MSFDAATPFSQAGQLFDDPGSSIIITVPVASAAATAQPVQSATGGGTILITSGAASAIAGAFVPAAVDQGETNEEYPPVDWPVPPGEMHFRLEDPTLGRLELSCDTGYIVRQYDFGPPTIREVVYNNSFDDGTFDYTRFIGSRAVSLDIVLRPTQNVNGTGGRVSEPQMRDALVAYAHPSRRPRLTYSEHGDDRVKQIDLRASDFSAAVTQPMFNSIGISWVAPRGVIESSYENCVTRSIGETAGAMEIPVINRGNTNANWMMSITGELQQPKLYLDGDVDNALELEYDVGLGGSVVISSYSRSVLIAGEKTGYRYLSDNSTWFTIPPGAHTITFETIETTRVGYPFGKWEDDGASPVTTWASDGPHSLPGGPPWAWSTELDPETGEPTITVVTVCYRSTWI